MGLEIELKLGIAPSDLGKVAGLAWLSEISTGPAKTEKLVTVYFDTAKFKLREHGLALRIRHAGKKRLQTIKVFKKGGRGAFGRDQWEEKIASDTPDLKLAKDTALEPLATRALRRKLQPVFETVVDRTTFPIYSGEADLELALDRGYIKADASRGPISEIEIKHWQVRPSRRSDCPVLNTRYQTSGPSSRAMRKAFIRCASACVGCGPPYHSSRKCCRGLETEAIKVDLKWLAEQLRGSAGLERAKTVIDSGRYRTIGLQTALWLGQASGSRPPTLWRLLAENGRRLNLLARFWPNVRRRFRIRSRRAPRSI
jgi:hypothetical protein